ncbi:Putative ribonuclease H protein [Apostasia shenzhenica]|uniref:Ribonuclease H protein n=1 Tax=Apostasia shenzhenica TaxID=1088818 RepID=A0A2I0AHD3_9ASPA|nr:Putative ribonuclease H protein [Apostasia shenzhenica]
MALKIDMEQAYDRMRWDFLCSMLHHFGFPAIWINWVMACISNPRFQITFNGIRSPWITATCGLRQGCPLSPYLFILYSELLSLLIQDKLATNALNGIQLYRNGPVLSHLLFADDIFIFASATHKAAMAIKNIFCSYCDASGQRINRAKSSIFFSNKTKRSRKRMLVNIFGFHQQHQGKYLGIPLLFRKPKKDDYISMISQIRSQISLWGVRSLSFAGRLTLINSVLSSIPVYSMSHTFMPKSILASIEQLIRQFLWSGDMTRNSLHYVNWNSIAKPKASGGLGIHHFSIWRRVLIAKLAAYFYTKHHSLWVSFFQAKYGNCQQVFSFKRGDSYVWQLICHSDDLIVDKMK